MKGYPLSAVGVAVLVLLAGSAVSTGATMADSQQRTLDATPDALDRQDGENATVRVNATLETVELRNVTITNVSLDHVHVTGNVTTGDETVLETGNGTETVENITAQRLRVANATLENVSLSELTVRNESLATALFGMQPTGDQLTVSSATLEDRTIDGFVIEHGSLGDVTLGELQLQSGDAMETGSEEARRGAAAMEIFSASVGNATLEEASLVGATVNETTTTETAD